MTGDGVFRLLEAAWEVLPDVRELEWEGARSRPAAGQPDNAPVVGRGGLDGLVWATGHYRNGVLLAPLTGAGVADLLEDAEPPAALAAFGPERFAPPAAATASWHEARDEGGAERTRPRGSPRGPRWTPRWRPRARPRSAAWRWPWTARWCRAGSWTTTELREGQKVEVLQAVQGG